MRRPVEGPTGRENALPSPLLPSLLPFHVTPLPYQLTVPHPTPDPKITAGCEFSKHWGLAWSSSLEMVVTHGPNDTPRLSDTPPPHGPRQLAPRPRPPLSPQNAGVSPFSARWSSLSFVSPEDLTLSCFLCSYFGLRTPSESLRSLIAPLMCIRKLLLWTWSPIAASWLKKRVQR